MIEIRRQKPPPGTVIDWTHPLARGLYVHIPYSDGAGRPAVLGGTCARATQPGGAPTWSGGRRVMVSAYDVVTDPVIGLANRPFSLVVRFVPYSVSAGGQCGVCHVASHPLDATPGYVLYIKRTANRVSHVPNNVAYVTGTLPISEGVEVSIGASYRVASGSQWAFFQDGNLDGLYSTTNGGGNRASLYVGTGYGGALNGAISSISTWTRALSPDEMRWVSAEPHAFMRVAPWRRVFDMGGGASFRPAWASNANAVLGGRAA